MGANGVLSLYPGPIPCIRNRVAPGRISHDTFALSASIFYFYFIFIAFLFFSSRVILRRGVARSSFWDIRSPLAEAAFFRGTFTTENYLEILDYVER